MTLSYMLDTDMCSFAMKRSHARVVERLKATPVEEVCISVISKSELLYGVEISPSRNRDSSAVAAFLRYVSVLHFPDEAAAHYADIRAHLTKRGTMIGANDLFIAAHARSLDLALVTNNQREFRRVPRLRTDNWAN